MAVTNFNRRVFIQLMLNTGGPKAEPEDWGGSWRKRSVEEHQPDEPIRKPKRTAKRGKPPVATHPVE